MHYKKILLTCLAILSAPCAALGSKQEEKDKLACLRGCNQKTCQDPAEYMNCQLTCSPFLGTGGTFNEKWRDCKRGSPFLGCWLPAYLKNDVVRLNGIFSKKEGVYVFIYRPSENQLDPETAYGNPIEGQKDFRGLEFFYPEYAGNVDDEEQLSILQFDFKPGQEVTAYVPKTDQPEIARVLCLGKLRAGGSQ